MALVEIYTAELVKRIKKSPNDYRDSVETAPALAESMLGRIRGGARVSLNCNPALKAACAKVGVTSFAGLVTYLADEEASCGN